MSEYGDGRPRTDDRRAVTTVSRSGGSSCLGCVGWLVLVLAAIVTLAVEAYALFWLSFGMSADNPSPETVASGTRMARDLTLIILAPWLLASTLVPRRLPIALTGFACAMPAMWFWWDLSHMH